MRASKTILRQRFAGDGRWQGGVIRGELDMLGNGLRRVGASLCGSIENLVSHCTHTFTTSGLAAATACKPIQLGRHRIKVCVGIATRVSVSLSVCMHVRVCLRAFTGTISTNFSVRVTCGCGSVLHLRYVLYFRCSR